MMHLARRLASSRSAFVAGARRSMASVVEFDIAELVTKDSTSSIRSRIEEAYGENGLGLLVVHNIPGFASLRQSLLKLGNTFAHSDYREQYVVDGTQVGWVHGKEMFNGKPDLLKANYTANPQYNYPAADPEMQAKYPSYCTPNVWPDQHLPMLEFAYMHLGQLMVDVGAHVGRHCDTYVNEVWGWDADSQEAQHRSLENVITQSRTCKSRLLQYFPPSSLDEEVLAGGSDSWCGWHNDHGSLTALTCSQFFDQEGRAITQEDAPQGRGLAIRPRPGNDEAEHTVEVSIPPDALAFQIGESSQLLSAGALRATPHAVLMPSEEFSGMSRSTFACFMQPNVLHDMTLPEGVDPAKALESNPLVPSLAQRFDSDKPGFTFYDFTQKTLDAYYQRNNPGQ